MFQFRSNIKMLTYSAALLLFLIVSVQPVESSKIRSYKILEGDNLLVICNVTDDPDIEVFWTKNDTKSSFMQPGKRLEILNIKRSFSGDYICHALNTSFPVPEYNETDANKTAKVINVDVQYPAEINYFSIAPTELLENQTFTVTCDLQGHPGPVWSIRNRDSGIVMMAANAPARVTLGAAKVPCRYMGYWECTGSNYFNNGVNVTRGHNIRVFCPPRPQFYFNQYIVQANVGNHTQLQMQSEAYPSPNYTWTKDDGKDISNVTKQDDFENGTTLTFPMMSIPYFGNYTLKMQNKYGIYFAKYQIVANGKPEAPTNLHFSHVTFDSVKLQWTSGFDMGSRQHFNVMVLRGNQYIQYSLLLYDNSTNHGINQNWTHVLTNLDSDTHYNLTIVSQNDRGFSSDLAQPSISFRTKLRPKEYEKSNTKLIIGLTFGIIATIGLAAILVYMLKYRGLSTSYAVMGGKNEKI